MWCKLTSRNVKVIFLAADTRPRFNKNGCCTFDVKLGIWPDTFQERVKHSPCNEPARKFEIKNLVVNREVYTKFLFEKVYPTVREK